MVRGKHEGEIDRLSPLQRNSGCSSDCQLELPSARHLQESKMPNGRESQLDEADPSVKSWNWGFVSTVEQAVNVEDQADFAIGHDCSAG